MLPRSLFRLSRSCSTRSPAPSLFPRAPSSCHSHLPPGSNNNPSLFRNSARTIVTDAIGVQELKPGLYASKELMIMHGSKGVYGGQIVGQALLAATKTVDAKFHVNSLHSYFILPGDNTLPIEYSVEIIRNGRLFCSRNVVARQRNKTIFTMTCSFQVFEHSNLEHQHEMPRVMQPGDYPKKSSSEGVRNLFGFSKVKDVNLNGDTKPELKFDSKFVSFPGAIEADCRFIGHPALEKVGHMEISDHELSPYLLWWYKATGDLSGESNLVHQSAVAYHSDYQLVYTSLLPHKVGGRPESEFLTMMVSLDHCIWFHAPVRGDEWLLYVMQSHRASCGRGLLTGKLFNISGALVASVVQEGFLKSSNNVINNNNPKYIASHPPNLSLK